jgi:hypothetical protein
MFERCRDPFGYAFLDEELSNVRRGASRVPLSPLSPFNGAVARLIDPGERQALSGPVSHVTREAL